MCLGLLVYFKYDEKLTACFVAYMGFPKMQDRLLGQDYSALGSILGSPYFGKLLYETVNPQVEDIP